MVRYALLLGILLLNTGAGVRTVPQASFTAMVTVRVHGLDEASWPRVSAGISKEQQVNLEYSCLSTGVLVLRVRSLNFSERADVMSMVKRMLQEAGVKGRVEFLDVQVIEDIGNRCHHLPQRQAGALDRAS